MKQPFRIMNSRRNLQGLLTVLAISLLAGRSVGAGELQLGTASVQINPPVGIGLAGYYHERGNEGMLDDISAKATVLDDGSTRAAIVICDLISMPKWIVVKARQLIEKRTGIPAANVMIAATHTHTAPVLYREWSRDESDGGGKVISKDYSRTLPGLIAEAVAAANNKRQPARISVATEHEPQLAQNRRYWMRDGSVGWNPGKLNPQIVRPAGPIDPEVGVLYAETIAVKPVPMLTFVNYAMHPDTTGGTQISADYPGALARALALYKGGDMLTLFANGTCGNINHVDVRWGDPQKGPQEATRIGTILAASVFKAYSHLTSITNPGPLRVRSEIVKLPLPRFTP